ncbi:MAG: hypothetical protein ACJ8GN_15100 [Longimicrobiaceae bacterium]
MKIVDAAPLPYAVSVPAGAEAPLPVLCFLHGYDEAAPMELAAGVARHGPLRPGGSPLATRDFIVVAPQLPLAGDHWHAYADAVRRIVGGVRAEHGGDPARTYLTGFSFGGNGVLDLALAQPDFWAALWAVDPTRVPREEIRRPVWLSFGAVARRGRDAFVRALALALAPAEGDAPAGDRLYLDEGEDHVGSATRAYRDDRIYRWLLTQRLPRGTP